MPKFSNGDRVRVNPASPSPYRGRIGTIVDDSSADDLGYMVRFEWRGLRPATRFMEADLEEVSDELTASDTSVAGMSNEWTPQGYENQFIRISTKTKYIYMAAVAVLVIAGIIFGVRAAIIQTGSEVPSDFGSASSDVQQLPGGTANETMMLEFTTELADAVAGEPFSVQPVVKIVDLDGNTVDTSLPVSLAVSNSDSDLYGITTITAVNGTATFSNIAMIDAGKQYHLKAICPGITAVMSNAFDVKPGEPTKLKFTSDPSASGLPARFSTQVSVMDVFGNLITDSTAEVTLSINPDFGPEGAVLSGVTTKKASGGVASFSYLTITPANDYYELKASSPGLDPDVCFSFNPTIVAPEQKSSSQ